MYFSWGNICVDVVKKVKRAHARVIGTPFVMDPNNFTQNINKGSNRKYNNLSNSCCWWLHDWINQVHIIIRYKRVQRMAFWLSAFMEAVFWKIQNSKIRFLKKSEFFVQVNKDVRHICIKFQDGIHWNVTCTKRKINGLWGWIISYVKKP